MKKLFLFSVLVIASSFCYAQDIDEDIYDDNGNRTIITDEGEFGNDHEVRMVYEIPKGAEKPTKLLDFLIEDNGKMEKGRLLLIKFEDGSVMELKNRADVYPHFRFPHMVIEPMFVVTDEQLDQICTKNVVKVRFEQDNDMIDVNVKRNKMSKFITKCRAYLDEALNNKRDVRANF